MSDISWKPSIVNVQQFYQSSPMKVFRVYCVRLAARLKLSLQVELKPNAHTDISSETLKRFPKFLPHHLIETSILLVYVYP